MRSFRLVPAAILLLGMSLSAFAMGAAEVLRYPVRTSSDGSLAVISTTGGKVERMNLPASSQDGYRFSWQGSFYELVTYSTGRYAVMALDPYLKGRSLRHALYMKGRENPRSPIPEWVTDERLLLSDLPQYAGVLALRYSKASMASTKKLSTEQVLRDTIQPFLVSTLGNPSDADRATAAILADDLTLKLASQARLSTYWIEVLRRDPDGAPKDTSYVSTRKIYALVELPFDVCLAAVADLQRTAESGGAPEYAGPSGAGMLANLSELLRKEAGIGAVP